MNKLINILYSSFSIPGLRLGIIAALAIFFTFNILRSNADNLNSFSEIQRELKIYENWPEEKTQLLGEINELKRRVSKAGSDIYSFDQDNEYFGKLFKFCEENRLKIERWDTEDIKINPHHVGVTIEIRINGKAQSLLNFLHDLETGSNPVTINAINIKKNLEEPSIRLETNVEILFKR